MTNFGYKNLCPGETKLASKWSTSEEGQLESDHALPFHQIQTYCGSQQLQQGQQLCLDFSMLFYQAQLMQPLASLNYYGISKKSTVHVVAKLRCWRRRGRTLKKSCTWSSWAISQNNKRFQTTFYL